MLGKLVFFIVVENISGLGGYLSLIKRRVRKNKDLIIIIEVYCVVLKSEHLKGVDRCH
jgi:hypothetical protein